jgi:hypothetical protein
VAVAVEAVAVKMAVQGVQVELELLVKALLAVKDILLGGLLVVEVLVGLAVALVAGSMVLRERE